MPPIVEKAAEADERVYLFSGQVDSRRKSMVDRLAARMIAPEFETFDLEKFDGDSSSSEAILSAVATLPFGSPRKVVIVDRVDRLDPNDQAKIAAFIPKLGDKSCLILLAGEDAQPKRKPSSQKSENADEDDPSKRKKGLQTVLTAAVKAHGKVTNMAKMRAQDVTALVAATVKASGKKIDSAALQALSHSVQATPSIMEREIDKLVAYVAERDTITVTDVEKVTTRSPEDRVFALIDAVAAGRADSAMQLLNETLAASTKPDGEMPKVLALLARHFRLLIQAKYLVVASGNRHLDSAPDELQELLMREVNPLSLADWQKPKIMDQLRHFTLEELEHCLHQILQSELTLKGLSKESTSPRLNIEMLILKLTHRKALAAF
jgi:DNA polymerase-3 subunit delta